ncbi:uncharacterized protein LOC143919269 isoform X1 [Arctopsyche grandis]|uniref:uncharacterized protein LOC143919269 isoform X1 n=1 Tax=Arctopsyche grandis TaxID=121162 RepID=UPI00406D900A
MASDEQFSLCWNNFHSNMSTGFHGLLSRGDLVDVTLAAEGRMLQAHKIVLSVCSPYFQDLFKMNPTQHPIVFLKDVSYTVLKDLLQFMYQGEVNVKQEELASFISTAEQLQVKGLTGNQTDDGVPTPKPKPSPRPGPRSSQQRQAIKPETDVDTKQNPVAIKRPSRPSATPSNASSSQPAPAKRKCIDPLEPGPSGNSKDDFVTIADEDDNAAVAPKMEPEFNDALWEDDDDGTNNDDGNFGEDDSNLEMSGFGDGSVTGDTTIAGATGEGGAVGDAQDSNHSWLYLDIAEEEIDDEQPCGSATNYQDLRGRRLPTKSIVVLKRWLVENRYRAYPSISEKKTMSQESGLTRKQISNWFINARRRILPEIMRRESNYTKDFVYQRKRKITNNQNSCGLKIVDVQGANEFSNNDKTQIVQPENTVLSTNANALQQKDEKEVPIISAYVTELEECSN